MLRAFVRDESGKLQPYSLLNLPAGLIGDLRKREKASRGCGQFRVWLGNTAEMPWHGQWLGNIARSHIAATRT
jgi:hypothetical protein